MKVEAMEQASRAPEKPQDRKLKVKFETMEHTSWNLVVVTTTAQARLRPNQQMQI